MRPAHLADVEIAARVLLRHPPREHSRLIMQLLAEADAGEWHWHSNGIPHVDFGSGTLMSAANKHPLAPRPSQFDTAACEAFLCVFNALREKQCNQNK